MKIERPSYYLKLDMSNITRVVTINGFQIESDYEANSSRAEFPINHVIRNGENYLRFVLPPQDVAEDIWDDTSKCYAEIRVKGKVNGEEVDYKVADLAFSGDYTAPKENQFKGSMPAGKYKFSIESPKSTSSDEDTIVGPVQFNSPDIGDGIERTFVAKVPFPEWAFFSGDQFYNISSDDEMFDKQKRELWVEVQKIWKLFEDKKIDVILSLMEARSKEYDQAFYREPGNTLEQLRHSIERVYRMGYPLDKVDFDQMELIPSDDGRMATIVNAATENGTVLFYDEESDSDTFYTIHWMKKNGKWIIAR